MDLHHGREYNANGGFRTPKTFLILAAILALATSAYPSTVWSYSISTDAVGQTPCSASGSGPGSASCLSDSSPGTGNGAAVSVSLTDNSLQILADSLHAAHAIAFASITHDDFYDVPVNGPVSALVSLTCDNGGNSGLLPTGHFSLGSTIVSPPVETKYQGASQGSGPCGLQYRIFPSHPDDFVVSLVATNNIVHLQTYIDATAFAVDVRQGITVQLTVNGFQDANGNPIAATLVTPEPGTWAMFGLAFLVGAVRKAKQTFSA